MMLPDIRATELTPEAFAPFGDVMEAPPNTGRLHFAADLTNLRPQAKLNLSIVRAPSALGPLSVAELEQHPFSAQAFVPLDVEAYLVVVASNDENSRPILSSMKAFVARGDQCICYRPGIWHLGMTALRGKGSFVLLVYEVGTSDDCRFSAIPRQQIHFQSARPFHD